FLRSVLSGMNCSPDGMTAVREAGSSTAWALFHERDDACAGDEVAVPGDADVAVAGERQVLADVLRADVGERAVAGDLQHGVSGVEGALDREGAVACDLH